MFVGVMYLAEVVSRLIGLTPIQRSETHRPHRGPAAHVAPMMGR
jgi:hypothetical protein